jgi:hypothetical protein
MTITEILLFATSVQLAIGVVTMINVVLSRLWDRA